MDFCHFKSSALAERVCRHSEAEWLFAEMDVAVDAVRYSVLAEEGAPAFQMTAATVLNGISRLPGMVGEANEAVSTDIQVKVSASARLLKLPKTECTTVWI